MSAKSLQLYFFKSRLRVLQSHPLSQYFSTLREHTNQLESKVKVQITMILR